MTQRELYQSLEVNNDEGLLRTFPSRYEDLTPSAYSEPVDGEKYIFKGSVSSVRPISARGISLIRFRLDIFGSVSIPCMLINQQFYLNKLAAGKELLAVLYYSENRKTYIVNALYDLDSFAVMSQIKPVYSLPKAVSQSYFVSTLRKILSHPREDTYMLSPLPKRLVEKYHFINEFDAFRCVHFPSNKKDLNAGLRVFKYEEALEYSIRSLSLRMKSDRIKKDNSIFISHEKINSFVSSLAFKLTSDQLSAIHDIVLDMESEHIMYRLLQGDVGCGKTMVAFVSLYANYLREKQGVFLAPTFELALQHYKNALNVFKDYNLNIKVLLGSTSTKEKKNILNDLENGEIDILISTHAVFSDSVKFKSLGLTIIDEQQLFGVEQREKLILKGDSNDVLMMSATPIPRTLSQIINADLDVTTLKEFPHGKRNVKTSLVNSKDPIIYKAIEKALLANRQCFIVSPKIEDGSKNTSSAESVYKEIVARFKEENVQLLHGKIKKDVRDKILEDFASGKKKILVSTTVIEVGIDVSSACLLIVYDANYFGLSSLHQLRGRIGRNGEFALALLVYDGKDKDAIEKLNYLTTTEDGLLISQFDLKQRGSGSYSGSNQSGKSELKVCNFVDDLTMFEYAKKDALEILLNPSDSDNASYLKSLTLDKKLLLA